jgi:peptide deformylase
MIVPIKIVTDIEELKKPNSVADLYEAKSIIEKLEIALKNAERPGVGLAAPQIGIHKQVAIIRVNSEEGEDNIDLVNPVIIEQEQGIIFKDEGCLSLPGVHINTRRYQEVFIKDDLHPAGVILYGMAAVACVHEIDHLFGILITDRATGKTRVGRNDPCPCGKIVNNKVVKYKHCHGK